MNRILEDKNRLILAAVLLLAGVLSFTLIHDLYLKWSYIKYAITYLDNKANTVLALTGASTSASVAITMIPGDIGTPIATQLASISSYSIIVLAAVHLEKYLITMAALLGLRILIPAACVIAAVNEVFLKRTSFSSLSKKLCVFAIALVLVVPASVYLSTTIEKTYDEDVMLSIEQTKKEADEIRNTLEQSDQSLWDKVVSTLSGGTREVLGKFENSLNNFVEAISVMLITACVIPIMTFAVLLWLIKALFQIDLRPPSLEQLAMRARIKPLPTADRNKNSE